MKIHIKDMDADGHNDAVICGKGGLYVFYRRGTTPTGKPKHRLPPEEDYPTWKRWQQMPLPEPAPIPRKTHGKGPRAHGFEERQEMRAMRCIFNSLIFAALTTTSAWGQGFMDPGELRKQGFEPLFNGTDFSSWKVPEGDNGHWKVIDGVIDYDARSEAKGDKSLYTDEEFHDYEFYFEWRFKQTSGLYPMPIVLPDGSLKTDENGEVIKVPTPNADSGLLFRPGHQANLWCWPCGSGELWMLRNNKDATPKQRAAAVPKTRADKPVGEWNAMLARVVGDRVTIVLNGKTVIDDAQLPGVKTSGRIGFQHHGGPLSSQQIERMRKRGMEAGEGDMSPASSLVQFRNIHVKRLETAATDWNTLFDGTNLDAFRMGPDQSWVIEDEVIALRRREYDGKEHNADYLWTRERYGDFVLELEFQTQERANSGVFLRTSDLKRPRPHGNRGAGLQLLRQARRQPRRHGRCDLRLPGTN